MTIDDPFPPGAFDRLDESDDPVFYAEPRKTVHIDEGAVAALRAFYGGVLPEGGAVLDLMSSWRSHLPEDRRYGRVVGIGLNGEEMADNPALDEVVVRDLNREPRLPFDDGAFDAAIVSVSVQYMTQPVALFREVGRVLRPGGPFCVAFSDRCFWDKAVRMWRESDNEGHIAIVRRYFDLSEAFDAPEVVRQNRVVEQGGERDGMGAFGGVDGQERLAGGPTERVVDPMFVVWARRRKV